MPTKVSREIVLGAMLIAAGVLLLGADLQLWARVSLWQLWPVALIGVGLSSGPLRREGFSAAGSGVVLLLFTTHALDWRDWWPLFIVVHGIGLLLAPSDRGCHRKGAPRVH